MKNNLILLLKYQPGNKNVERKVKEGKVKEMIVVNYQAFSKNKSGQQTAKVPQTGIEPVPAFLQTGF